MYLARDSPAILVFGHLRPFAAALYLLSDLASRGVVVDLDRNGNLPHQDAWKRQNPSSKAVLHVLPGRHRTDIPGSRWNVAFAAPGRSG